MALSGLDAKVAVVAGGATGIGAATARLLGAEGCRVVVGDINTAAALKRMHHTRVGEPDDIAAMVAFLMSEEGSWVNGQVISIDGGAILR